MPVITASIEVDDAELARLVELAAEMRQELATMLAEALRHGLYDYKGMADIRKVMLTPVVEDSTEIPF